MQRLIILLIVLGTVFISYNDSFAYMDEGNDGESIYDFRGEWLRISVRDISNYQRIRGLLKLENTGNAHFTGQVKIQYYLSDDEDLDESDNYIKHSVVNMRWSRGIAGIFHREEDLSGKYLIALIDPDDEVNEIQEDNNEIVVSVGGEDDGGIDDEESNNEDTTENEEENNNDDVNNDDDTEAESEEEASECEEPYHVLASDGRCVWSCSEGTTPDNDSGECICKEGFVETDTDEFGRRVCEEEYDNGELIEQNETDYGIVFGYSDYYENIKVAQSFIPTQNGMLQYVEFYLSTPLSGDPPVPEDLILCTLLDSNWDVIAETTTEGFDSGEQWITCDFSDGELFLEAGASYIIAAEVEGSTYTLHATGDVYPDGAMYDARESMGGEFNEKSWDAAFRVKTGADSDNNTGSEENSDDLD